MLLKTAFSLMKLWFDRVKEERNHDNQSKKKNKEWISLIYDNLK